MPPSIPDSYHYLQKTRNDSLTLQDEVLASLEKDPNKAKIICHIQKAEEVRCIFLKLKHLIHPFESALVTHVLVPDDNLPTTITNSDDIISSELVVMITTTDVQQFSSAHGMPFTVPPLSQDFNWDATTLAHQATLDGRPVPLRRVWVSRRYRGRRFANTIRDAGDLDARSQWNPDGLQPHRWRGSVVASRAGCQRWMAV